MVARSAMITNPPNSTLQRKMAIAAARGGMRGVRRSRVGRVWPVGLGGEGGGEVLGDRPPPGVRAIRTNLTAFCAPRCDFRGGHHKSRAPPKHANAYPRK